MTTYIDATQESTVDNALATEPHFETMLVTPELAAEWIKRNDANRNLRSRLVAQYADDMLNGRWTFNGEAIQFSVSGRLINGQHRLHAVVKSGQAQKFLVGFDLPEETQTTFDSGARRTAADALRMDGRTHGNLVASVCKLIHCEKIERGYLTFDEQATSTALIQDMADADPDIEAAADFINHLPCKKIAPPSALAYAFWKCRKIDGPATREFFYALDSMANLPVGSPILALHKRLSQYKSEGSGNARNSRDRQALVIATFFQAWNAWRRGENRTMIKVMLSADHKLRAQMPI